MKPIDFTPSARDELRAAIDWYESRNQGLGLRFFEVIDEALAAIVHAPLAFPAWTHDERVRKFAIDKFPYVVFYRERDDALEVIAVAHTAREPGYWTDWT